MAELKTQVGALTKGELDETLKRCVEMFLAQPGKSTLRKRFYKSPNGMATLINDRKAYSEFTVFLLNQVALFLYHPDKD